MADRVVEALALLHDAQVLPGRVAGRVGGPPLYKSDADALAAAQVLATLELAEQQRLANVIALGQVRGAASDVPVFTHLVFDLASGNGVVVPAHLSEGLSI